MSKLEENPRLLVRVYIRDMIPGKNILYGLANQIQKIMILKMIFMLLLKINFMLGHIILLQKI